MTDMAYPADANPFADPFHKKAGRPPRDHFSKEKDEKINQRYLTKAFIILPAQIDRVLREAGEWGFDSDKIVEMSHGENEGRLLVTFKKKKGPLVSENPNVHRNRQYPKKPSDMW